MRRFSSIALGVIALVALIQPGAAYAVSTTNAAAKPTVKCTKNIQNTWGKLTCKTSGGRVTFSEVRFNCDWEVDWTVNDLTIEGEWSKTHECDHKLLDIYWDVWTGR
ncbi:hypothetical protein [Pilimelia columellifera]